MALVADQADADLGDGDQQGVVSDRGAIARLQLPGEQHLAGNLLQIGERRSVVAGLRRGVGGLGEQGEQLAAHGVLNAPLLFNGGGDLGFKPPIEVGKVDPGLPAVQIEGVGQRLAIGGRVFVTLDERIAALTRKWGVRFDAQITHRKSSLVADC